MKSLLQPVGRILKISGITLGSILLIMFLLPIVFPGYVNGKIKQWTNSAITGELNFSKVRLSFFNHFPSLSKAVTIDELYITDAKLNVLVE